MKKLILIAILVLMILGCEEKEEQPSACITKEYFPKLTRDAESFYCEELGAQWSGDDPKTCIEKYQRIKFVFSYSKDLKTGNELKEKPSALPSVINIGNLLSCAVYQMDPNSSCFGDSTLSFSATSDDNSITGLDLESPSFSCSKSKGFETVQIRSSNDLSKVEFNGKIMSCGAAHPSDNKIEMGCVYGDSSNDEGFFIVYNIEYE